MRKILANSDLRSAPGRDCSSARKRRAPRPGPLRPTARHTQTADQGQQSTLATQSAESQTRHARIRSGTIARPETSTKPPANVSAQKKLASVRWLCSCPKSRRAKDKIKALKERTAATNKDDREPRESKTAQESKKLRDFGGN